MTSLTMTAGTTGLLARVAKFFVNLNEKRIQRKEINRTIKQLSALSDRELNDMGIARGDIWAVAHGDPSFKRSGLDSNENLKGWV
jgi:uncharacterized protein YjiS (DUF1127 family)